MNRQTYADNVDSNGVPYKTIGDNIRDGAKGAESVVKALQSDEINFEMQAIMNVLPFMDSTKKIIKVKIVIKNGVFYDEGGIGTGDSYSWQPKIPIYGFIIGKCNRGTANFQQGRFGFNINNNGIGITANSELTANITNYSLELFLAVDK
nr:MAG TPA: hypothetical protein [Caudoviricetes sp.]